MDSIFHRISVRRYEDKQVEKEKLMQILRAGMQAPSACNQQPWEFYIVEEDQAKLINDTKKNGGRVISVGTTSCRTLESATGEDGIVKAGSGWTEIFIYPGYKFKAIDGLITNFHLPESTLLMLVSALAGKEHIMAAYEEAVKERYRFFSFGDAMMIE